MAAGQLHRLSAFSTTPDGGNPAGVWIGEELPDAGTMQRIARDVGYSETAFLAPAAGLQRTVRYFSPQAEVPFCGHATIAAGVVLGSSEGHGTFQLATAIGTVPVAVHLQEGSPTASLTSVEPRQKLPPASLVQEALAALGWREHELDPALPPALAYAGAWHLVLAAASLERLQALDYDFERLKALMQANELTTLQLVWREGPLLFHARNPFPVGGVVEDPATGSAAAALGGYLRAAGLIPAPSTFRIRQGEAMGRPSLIVVEVPAEGGIRVSGQAVGLNGTHG